MEDAVEVEGVETERSREGMASRAREGEMDGEGEAERCRGEATSLAGGLIEVVVVSAMLVRYVALQDGRWWSCGLRVSGTLCTPCVTTALAGVRTKESGKSSGRRHLSPVSLVYPSSQRDRAIGGQGQHGQRRWSGTN